MKKDIKKIEQAIDKELMQVEAKTEDKKVMESVNNIRKALSI